jgi:hypothetical protein
VRERLTFIGRRLHDDSRPTTWAFSPLDVEAVAAAQARRIERTMSEWHSVYEVIEVSVERRLLVTPTATVTVEVTDHE